MVKNKIASDESCTESSSSEIQNSATEISTDSEFAQDDPTPTREAPKKIFDDYVTKVRGSSGQPKKVQVKSGILQQPINGRAQNKNIELKFTPLVPTVPTVAKKSAPTTLLLRNEGYPLNRTQSTGGIATKVSLELKKKYLLGESNVSGSIQKSGSASTLDSKFKLFHTNISDCQKLLKPASEISASMKVFCNKLNERTSPLSPTFASPTKKTELPKIDITKCASESSVKFVNESEGRPRSPVHERSIIVPTIDWEKNKPKEFTDSLSSSDSSEFNDKNVTFNNIPRLEVHDDSGEIVQDEAFDSLNVIINDDARRINEPPKSITTEKKSLNQPKALPNLDDSILTEMHSALHTKPDEYVKNTSGRSSPSINEDAITAALTETELSDWARDGVSDDFEDIPHLDVEKQTNSTELKRPPRAEFGENEQKHNIAECVNSILYPNIDNIEFMDTGTETSSDDNVEIKNNGYVQFHNEDDFVEDSLPPSKLLANSTIKIIESLQPKLKQNCDNEIVVETGTTTEENTCSDSTVKNITERTPDFKPIEAKKFVDKDRKRLEDKLVQVKLDMAKLNEQKNLNPLVCEAPSVEFEEHCQRLQSKIEFSNVKDSIDIRKSRRKSKTESVKPDLIQEEKINSNETKTLNLTSKLYKKEEIEKERDINQKLVQEMVMNKMRAQNKSLERKKRVRNSFSPIRSFELSKSATIDVASRVVSPLFAAPDVLLSTIPPPLQKSQTITNIHSCDDTFKTPKAPPRLKNEEAKKTAEKLKENARARVRLLSDEDLGLSPEDKIQKLKLKVKKNVDVHIQDSIESLVINTERRNSLLYNDTLKRNTSFRRSKSGDGRLNSQSSYDLTGKLSVAKAPEVERTKSVSDINKPVQNFATAENAFCKSDPNLLMDGRKKKKDRERRKSITKFLADIFVKRNSPNKSFLSRISPKSKNKSKSCVALDQEDIDKNLEEPALRRNSISEVNLRCEVSGNVSPPPIPPLPVNYTGSYLSKDESSDAENEFKRHDRSSCDTLDQSGVHDGSVSSFNARRSSRGARKAVRQAQLKRHRMAQEIQRKLEETEVKTRELENRGVAVEKALRGESNGSTVDSGREESDLLKEWFDLMRDRTELRRYERELMVQAQELELEDRHARLQHELRERLEDDEPKTAEKMEVEGSIIKEMMEIVSKRDSLITLLEEDRIRYSEEDRDFEEQMLAKGIHLTPLAKPLDQ